MVHIGFAVETDFSGRPGNLSGICSLRHRLEFIAVVLVALAGVCLSGRDGVAQDLASDWVVEDASKVRLIGGSEKIGGRLVAGVEMQLDPGWKTYWRNPGEAGGVPPEFTFSKSENLSDAIVLYPVPQVFVDQAGKTIGYKNRVVFPVRISPNDPATPVKLSVNMHYGICENICVPVEASLELLIPAANERAPIPEVLQAALEQVPRSGEALKDDDPRLVSTSAVLDGEKPSIVFNVAFPGDAAEGKLFVEALDGTYVPMARRLRDAADGSAQFEVDLAGTDAGDFKGTDLRVTAVGPAGQSETMIKLD